jgi:hypothetical protein
MKTRLKARLDASANEQARFTEGNQAGLAEGMGKGQQLGLLEGIEMGLSVKFGPASSLPMRAAIGTSVGRMETLRVAPEFCVAAGYSSDDALSRQHEGGQGQDRGQSCVQPPHYRAISSSSRITSASHQQSCSAFAMFRFSSARARWGYAA